MPFGRIFGPKFSILCCSHPHENTSYLDQQPTTRSLTKQALDTIGSTMTGLIMELPLGQLLENDGAGCSQLPESNLARGCELNKTTMSWDDVKVDHLLGSGTFASVYGVKELSFPLPNGDDKEKLTPGYAERYDESFTEVTLIQEDHKEDDCCFKDTRYLALKCCLSNTSPSNTLAVDCLVQEAIILQKLPPHPNIIKLFGVSSNLGCESTGFLLLQRVRETLDEVLFRSRLRGSFRKQVKWPIFLSFDLEHRKEQERSHHLQQRSRIQTLALGLARAMTFVHHNGVLYRDLKPSNVGIDYQGQARLFDFGFARTFEEEQGHLLTAMVGTPRYMSPEVACSHGKYGFPADVHSFAMVLWEILVLRKPFEKAKCIQNLTKALHVQQKRPSLKHVASPDIRSLLKASWHPDPDQRPTFALIVDQLEKEKASAKPCKKARSQSSR
jgi:serine/threonine protein kinase